MNIKHLARDAFTAAAVSLKKFARYTNDGSKVVLEGVGDRYKAFRDSAGHIKTEILKGMGNRFEIASVSTRAFEMMQRIRTELAGIGATPRLAPVRVMSRRHPER